MALIKKPTVAPAAVQAPAPRPAPAAAPKRPAPAAATPAPAPRAPAQPTAPAVAAPKVSTSTPGQTQANGLDPVLAKSLKLMKDRWNAAKAPSKSDVRSGTTLSSSSEGTKHICQLSNAKLINGSKGPSILLEWTCVQGDETGEKAVIWLNFDTDDKLIWAQRDLRKLGADVDALDPETLPQLCKDLIEAAIAARITVKDNHTDKGDFINVYIDKVIDLEAEGLVAAEQTLETDAEADVATETEAGAEQATEETTEVPIEEQTEEQPLAAGDDVSYTIKGKPQSGTILAFLDDDTANVKNDTTKKIDNVDNVKLKRLAAVEE